MSGPFILFWFAAGVSVITALGVILHRNPARAALLLVVNFLCLALFYFLLNAQVLAVFQILVYAGAIMVLFLFVIMLLNLGGEMAQTDPLIGQRFVGSLLGLALLGGLFYGIHFVARHAPVTTLAAERVRQAEAQGIPQIQIIGWDLFIKYGYPFELTSILLLVAVMGVITLAKRRAPGT